MTRFDLYILEPNKDNKDFYLDLDKLVYNERLNNKDLNIKIFSNPENIDIRGNVPGTIQLVGYFDDYSFVQQSHRTGFSRVGNDKVNGVVLWQMNILQNKTFDSDIDGILDRICDNISYFNCIIDKLNKI